ncbi:endoglucanase [Streptomyces albus subsp. albus]|nr:endoglucanase [Streptomyces albus subsp. albus]
MAEKGTRNGIGLRAVTLAAVGLSMALSGCATGHAEPTGADKEFWVNPDSRAAREVRRVAAQGRDSEAELLGRIAEQPVAEWIDQTPGERARAVTERAAVAGRTPVLVAYHIPYRDCGNHSAGGAEDSTEYRNWIRELAGGIGDRQAIVVLEPDAVAQTVDGCVPPQLRAERMALLRDATRTISRLPRAKVYLDAGNAGWIKDPEPLAAALRKSGIAHADGFSLNVANFQPTDRTRRYGHRLSQALGGVHFVIDTSRNGKGPVGGDEGHWCNPPGRALGERPSTRTGDALVDAYLWIKRPGESDGRCNGGPQAGTWWSRYALELARNAER